MTSKEIIVHVDKKGLEAIFETNDFSHSLFFSDLETKGILGNNWYNFYKGI